MTLSLCKSFKKWLLTSRGHEWFPAVWYCGEIDSHTCVMRCEELLYYCLTFSRASSFLAAASRSNMCLSVSPGGRIILDWLIDHYKDHPHVYIDWLIYHYPKCEDWLIDHLSGSSKMCRLIDWLINHFLGSYFMIRLIDWSLSGSSKIYRLIDWS